LVTVQPLVLDIADFSLNRLLQKTLCTIVLHSQRPTLTIVQRQLVSNTDGQGSSFASFPPLLPGRCDNYIEYISGWPLQVAARVPSVSAVELANAIIAEAAKGQARQMAANQPGLFLPSQNIAVTSLPAGQILLRPDAKALYQWLWYFVTADPHLQPGWPSRPSLPLPSTIQAPQGRALQLSPLTYLQYCHSRCYRLGIQGVTAQAMDLPAPDQVTSALLANLQPSNPHHLLVVKRVAKLLDHLVDPQASLPTVLAIGCQLAEATTAWLQEQTDLGHPNETQVWLLKTAQTTLSCLLTHGLQQPGATTF
jgi:hypothetical protein